MIQLRSIVADALIGDEAGDIIGHWLEKLERRVAGGYENDDIGRSNDAEYGGAKG